MDSGERDSNQGLDFHTSGLHCRVLHGSKELTLVENCKCPRLPIGSLKIQFATTFDLQKNGNLVFFSLRH